MAFGFTPSHTSSFSFEKNEGLLFLTKAAEAAVELGWEISLINESGFIAHSKFSMSSWSEQITLTINDGQATVVSSCTGNQFFDWGKNKRNIENFSAQLNQITNTWNEQHLYEKLDLLKNKFGPPTQELISQKNESVSFLSLFIPSQGYFVTPVLFCLNVFIFLLMAATGVGIFSPEGQSLVDWGANFRPATLQGDWWRLLSACFIHIGIFHLLLNMYALVYVGLVLEPYLKSTRFLTVYVATGVFASACSLWWHDYTVSAGASGAIFGLYGVLFALLTTNVLHKSVKKSFLTSTAIFIVYNLLNGLKPDSGIDNAAHIGGLASGMIMGYAMVPGLRRPEDHKLTVGVLVLTVVLFLGGSIYLYNSIPNDYATYDAEMRRFSELEERSLRVFHMPENTAAELLIKEITDKGLPGWNENLRIISGLEKLNLPLNIQTRNIRLKRYCELRIRHFELLARALNENTGVYEQELSESNEAIGRLIAEISEQ